MANTIDLAEYQYKLKLDSSEYSNNMKTAETQADSMKTKLSGVGDFIKNSLIGSFAALGSAAVGATAALTNLSVQGAAYADEILTQSSVTGMSTDALQEYSYAADLVDVSLDTLTGSMAKNVKAMFEAASGTEKYSDAYKKLGVTVTNADGSLRNSEDVYWETIDALGTIANETERDALAMELFGKSAQELNPLIAQGSAGIKELSAEAKNMGAVLSSESLSAFGAFDDNIQKLTQGSSAAKNALGGILLPQLTELSSVGVSLLGEFTSGLNAANGDMTKIGDVVNGVLSSAISIITEKLPEFINYGLEIISSIIGAIGENLPMLMSAITDISMTIIGKLIEALPDILKVGVDILLQLVNGITQALPDLIPAAVEAVMTIVQGLIDALPQILEAGLQIILGLTSGILKALPQLILALPDIILGIVNFLIGAIPQIIEAGIELLISLVDALPEIIDAIVLAIPLIVTGITSAFVDNIDKIIQAGVDLFIALVTNLPTIILEIVKAVPEILKGLVSAFTNSDNLKKMGNVGLDLIKGLWQGISDAGKWLYDKISGFFGGVVDKIKNFFGIASPSKLFRDQVGKNLALGIGEGFSDEMKAVTKDMKDSIPLNDLLSIGDISLPKQSTISFLGNSKSSSGSVINQQSDYKFEKLIDITFTGDINQDTLPRMEKLLKDIPGMVTKSLNEKLSARGVKGGGLMNSF